MSEVTSILQEVQDALADAALKVEKAISKLEGTSGSEATPPEWLQPRLRLFKAIKDRGGTIDAKELQKVKATLSYGKLSGFYKGKKGLIKLSGEKTALSKAAESRLDEWKDWAEKQPKV
jgi:hypothetical protein